MPEPARVGHDLGGDGDHDRDSCGDPNADGKTTSSDALYALRVSVGTGQCALCVCDVNKNGSITTTDALLLLKVAVGQLGAPTCVACG